MPLSRIQSFLLAQLLEKKIRQTASAGQDLAECEALDTMLDSVLARMGDDEECTIVMGLRMLYLMLCAFE